MDAFNGEDVDYQRVLREIDMSGYNGVPGAPDPEKIAPEHLHTKQDVRVELPSSCDPPGPANPPKELVWIVSDVYEPQFSNSFPSRFSSCHFRSSQHVKFSKADIGDSIRTMLYIATPSK